MGKGFGCKDSEYGNLLAFQDILYLDLSRSRVFINACESGSGPLNQGEGLMSMGQAFAMAGSNSIIQHFWKAPDLGAYEISLEYYRQLKWKSPSRSLKKSKNKYLDNCRPGYDHPFYWAGIIYYGDRSGIYKSNFFYFFLAAVGIAALTIIVLIIKNLNELS